MNALILKDLLNLRTSLKTLAVMMIIFGIIFIPGKNYIAFYFIMMIFAAMLPSTSISLDEMSKWDKYALTMPITRREIVKSKYILSIILACISLIISAVLTMIFVLAFPEQIEHSVVSPFYFVIVIFALGPLYGSIILPILYKFGSVNARYIMMGVIVIAGSAVLVIFMILVNVIGSVNPVAATLLPIAVSLAIMFISYKLSCRIYGRKEF
ncbi:MAG: ABC-2 transporter permease [Methanocorpusculum sp.]|nr:ABC-2 transporter permease [Methanocorpusculum sp.]